MFRIAINAKAWIRFVSFAIGLVPSVPNVSLLFAVTYWNCNYVSNCNQREGVDSLRFVCHRFSTECTKCLPFICRHVLELQLLIFFWPSFFNPFNSSTISTENGGTFELLQQCNISFVN